MYSAPAWGVSGTNHVYVYDLELNDGIGRNGASGSDFGNGLPLTPDGYPSVPINTNGKSAQDFMNDLKNYPYWNNGGYFPWLDDCHSELADACAYAGGECKEWPTGRVDFDESFWDIVNKGMNKYFSFQFK